jgi:peptide/nickel transport system substrate-binding protein
MLSRFMPLPSTLRRAAGPLARLGVVGAVTLMLSGAPMAAQETAEPLYGGTLIVGLATEPSSLNIVLTTNLPESMVTANIYNKLIRLGIDESFLPELAESWEVSDDALVYTFHLADNVTWHDGTPFTSADVKFSIEELTSQFHPNASSLSPIVSIETPDDHTVVMTVSEPSEALLTFLGLRTYILPKHVYEGTDVRENPANARPIGTGPFKFEEWVRGSHITLTRNEDYFQDGLPYLDQMVFQIMPDASSRVLALETGQVDYLTHDIPSTALEGLRANSDVVLTNEGVSSIVSIGQLMFNMDREPFDDYRVRKALTMAIDRDFVAERATLGAFTRADGPIHSSTAWAYAPDALTIYPHDPAAAEALLDEVGLTRDASGTRFEMDLYAPRGREDQMRAAEIIAQMFNEIGVQATVGIFDNAALGEVAYVNRDFDAFINTLSTGPDPSVGVQRQYVSSNIRPVPFTNASAYRNDEVDTLFTEAASAATREERIEKYRRIQEILSAELAVTWLWEVTPYSAWRTEFENLHNDSSAANYLLYTAWWTQGEPR